MKKRPFLKKAAAWAASIAVMIIIWAVAFLLAGNGYVVPSITETFAQMGQVLGEGSFYAAYGNTMLRSLEAFVISILAASVFAAISKSSKAARDVLAPIISVVRAFPTMAVILMLLVWLNPGQAPVAVTVLVLFPMTYTSTLAAFDQLDEDLVRTCRVYRIPLWRRFCQVYLPVSGAYLVSESGAALSFAVKLMVSAEVLSNTYRSLGGMISQAKVYLDMPRMMALTLLAVVTGVVIEALFELIVHVAFSWRYSDD